MWVICKHSKVFHKLSIADENAPIPQSSERFFAPKSGDEQEVPDWCAETSTFKAGVSDGSIRDLRPAALDSEKTIPGQKPKKLRDDSDPEVSKVSGFGLRKQKGAGGPVITMGE